MLARAIADDDGLPVKHASLVSYRSLYNLRRRTFLSFCSPSPYCSLQL